MNENFPKISIVTPSFNQAEYIEETINSVLSQNYPNLKYVIIDGGSKDNSVEIIKKYEKHLAYWISEPDKGHGNALNKGFSKTNGEIMGWLNSDDKYFPETFQTIADVFKTFNDVHWITGKQTFFDEQGRITHTVEGYKNIFDYLLGNYKWIQQESTFWRRNLWEQAGGFINEEYKLMVDGELWSRYFLHAELWHLNISIGGFRYYINNRGVLNYHAVEKEMEKTINEMRKHCSHEVTELFNDISGYLQNRIETRKKRNKKINNILPYFIYSRLVDIPLNNKLENEKKHLLENMLLKVKALYCENNHWEKIL